MKVRVISSTPYPEWLCEYAARVCYRSDKELLSGEFLQARIQQGHESIIEHASATFEVSGISRACSHQLVRHRTASYSQESQRYVDMSAADFVVPDTIMDYNETLDLWLEFTDNVFDTYTGLLALGVPKEDARFVLPNAAVTKIVVTMNFRELRHFFKVRCHKAAQWEIRTMAMEMLRLAHGIAPTVFGDIHDQFIGGTDGPRD